MFQLQLINVNDISNYEIRLEDISHFTKGHRGKYKYRFYLKGSKTKVKFLNEEWVRVYFEYYNKTNNGYKQGKQ